MWTRKDLLDQIEKSDGQFDPLLDGTLVFKKYKEATATELAVVSAICNNFNFTLWDHLDDSEWYVDSMLRGQVKEKLSAYAKLIDFIGVQRDWEIVDKKIAVSDYETTDDIDTVEKEIKVETNLEDKPEFLKGQVAVYERLIPTFKNINL